MSDKSNSTPIPSYVKLQPRQIEWLKTLSAQRWTRIGITHRGTGESPLTKELVTLGLVLRANDIEWRTVYKLSADGVLFVAAWGKS